MQTVVDVRGTGARVENDEKTLIGMGVYIRTQMIRELGKAHGLLQQIGIEADACHGFENFGFIWY